MAGFTVFESPVQPTAVVRGTPLMSEFRHSLVQHSPPSPQC